MFCQKCGTQLQEGVSFCSSCGTQQGGSPTVSVQNQALSMQDFLALSPEYEKKRAEMRKKMSLNIAIGVPICILGCVAGGIFFIFNLVLALFFVVIGITSAIISGTNESRFKKKLEKYGEELFRKYMSDK